MSDSHRLADDRQPKHHCSYLASRLFGLGGARLGALAGGAGNVVVGDPALVVGLAAGGGGGGLGAGEDVGGLGNGLLDLFRGAGSALGLGEEGLDPGLVDKVEGAGKGGGEDEVEEDAGVG